MICTPKVRHFWGAYQYRNGTGVILLKCKVCVIHIAQISRLNHFQFRRRIRRCFKTEKSLIIQIAHAALYVLEIDVSAVKREGMCITRQSLHAVVFALVIMDVHRL